jgi:hypothetical protein
MTMLSDPGALRALLLSTGVPMSEDEIEACINAHLATREALVRLHAVPLTRHEGMWLEAPARSTG